MTALGARRAIRSVKAECPQGSVVDQAHPETDVRFGMVPHRKAAVPVTASICHECAAWIFCKGLTFRNGGILAFATRDSTSFGVRLTESNENRDFYAANLVGFSGPQ